MVGTGKRLEVKRRSFHFSHLQCHVSNSEWLHLSAITASTRWLLLCGYSSNWDSVTTSYFFSALAFSPLVSFGCSLFLVPGCLPHHLFWVPLSLPIPLQYFFIWKKFLLGIEFWVDSCCCCFFFFLLAFLFSSLHGFWWEVWCNFYLWPSVWNAFFSDCFQNFLFPSYSAI